VPGSVTEAETFLWFRPSSRFQLGIAHLAKQNSVRFLASVNLVPETETTPSVNVSAGVQGISTGNPGYAVTFEKRYEAWTGYLGAGFRSNENRGRLIGGLRYAVNPQWNIGLQADGKQEHLFVTHDMGRTFAGLYLVDLQKPGFLYGFRF